MRRFDRPAPLRRGLRAAVLWLLAIVVPLQCGAALVRMAAGPMHNHAAATLAAPVPTLMLRDFRRDIGHAAAVEAPPVLATVLHGHGHPQRHHHPAADGGITNAGDNALERIDAGDDGGTSGGAFSALLPLVSAAPSWQVQASAQRSPTSHAWAASSRVPSMLERPPRGLQA